MLAALLSVCIIGTALTFTGCAKEENTSVADNSSTAETEPEESEEEAETSSEEPEENDNIEETTKTNSQKSDGKKIAFSLKNGNSWPEGNTTIYQLDGTVTNNQSDIISDWEVTLPVSKDIEIKNSWGLTYDLDGTTLIIKPDNNTGNIQPNGSINFGIQIASPEEINASDAVFTAENTSVSNNSHNNNNNNNNNSSSGGSDIKSSPNAREVPEPSTDDWLSVEKNKIVD